MSTYLIVGFLLVSLFFLFVIYAACVAAARANRRSSAAENEAQSSYLQAAAQRDAPVQQDQADEQGTEQE